jgi:subtilisin family serine protease
MMKTVSASGGRRRFVMVALAVFAVTALLAPIAPTPRADSAVEEPAHAVLVMFHGRANLERGRALHRRDARALRDPGGWDYLDRAVGGTVQELEGTHRFVADHMYSHAVRGFAARLTPRQIAALAYDVRVAHVELDHLWTRQVQTLPWGVDRVNADQSSTLAGNGSGAVGVTNVYVIDTGIGAHPELNVVRRVTMDPAWSTTDCHGHGTHVAGTVGARDNAGVIVGVSPGVALTGVKVLDCSGSAPLSTVIKGVDWVTANARHPAVVNMSLGGPPSDAGDAAIMNSVASGVVYVVAAGNDGTNACGVSPARLGTSAGVITVAATDRANREPSWSNYGSCVDVWAPGASILSTRLGGGTVVMSGTSMAAPHVTGAAALYRATYTGATPADVENAIKLFARSYGTFSKDGRGIRILNAASF